MIFILLLSQAGFAQGLVPGKDAGAVRLITLAPGHFHAALLQKYNYPQIDSTVAVFAPEGPELQAHLRLVDRYNTRAEDPTRWKEKVYAGPDYFEKMLREKPGNVVVIAGNNRDKTDFIKRSVDAGLNVLADKPMVIDGEGFERLRAAFADARKNKVLLYDIMTERYDITNRMLRELSRLRAVFGELKKGTLEEPAVTIESVHYFYKEVSGAPLVRPAWSFDVRQQGEGIVDVTTHLADLVQWECFPEAALDYEKDIRMLSARHWATVLTPGEFTRVTNEEAYPAFLRGDVSGQDSLLHVYANGEMNYTIRGVHVRISVSWKYKAPEGTGDTYYSLLRGTRADLVIRQGKEEAYKPVLYVRAPGGEEHAEGGTTEGGTTAGGTTKEEAAKGKMTESRVTKDGVTGKDGDRRRLERALTEGLASLQDRYPGIGSRKVEGEGGERGEGEWAIVIPGSYHIGHEQHFALVVKKYMEYLQKGRMPDWEVSGMLAKYYTLTQALKMAARP